MMEYNFRAILINQDVTKGEECHLEQKGSCFPSHHRDDVTREKVDQIAKNRFQKPIKVS